jgi:hypothetical protein
MFGIDMGELFSTIFVFAIPTLIGVSIGLRFTGPWIFVVSLAFFVVGTYLFYSPGHVTDSPEVREVATLILSMWAAITVPIVIGAWATWVVRKIVQFRNTQA